ncbi:MAG: 16S rRNA (guanine(527)-N(7))-methyltransferase RsmG [Erysipelotrichia bacterium]|nr:16S rRNA (guanine(527)-N(7))-methyltransferase RsmG [Erysipelotrichia bacterium]NCC55158.1 16S rRNA (guanine(527)-N(7))-methyltransferase RsmG [Erysipelotrichia bacterium]
MNLENYEINLYETLKEKGVVLSEQQLFQFRKYADLLIEWNEKMNLTAITERSEIYVKHFLDCILPSFHTSISGHLCDVGAGAGFPSIPLKIVYPDLKITILEPLNKRCLFLNTLVKELTLSDVQIKNERAEDYAKKHREYFDVVSARAVANLVMLSELCIPLVKEEGLFLAMKGSSGLEELEQAQYAIDVLGCQLINTDSYELEGAKRVNLCFKKVRKTAMKYPRMFAKIKKEPLVRRVK